MAGDYGVVRKQLGALRLHLGEQRGLVDPSVFKPYGFRLPIIGVGRGGGKVLFHASPIYDTKPSVIRTFSQLIKKHWKTLRQMPMT